nr:sulfatase-like hydrolase/transferase [Streptosporangium lutulentum]
MTGPPSREADPAGRRPARREGGALAGAGAVDQRIGWVQAQTSLTPDKPFFAYLSFGAVHAPHHVAPPWRQPYHGRFDHGWDLQRDGTLARQKELGVVPPQAELAPWPQGVPRWEQLSAQQKQVAAALMENYAAFAAHTDHQVNRLLDALTAMGVLDGTTNELFAFNGIQDTIERLVAELDKLGGPES